MNYHFDQKYEEGKIYSTENATYTKRQWNPQTDPETGENASWALDDAGLAGGTLVHFVLAYAEPALEVIDTTTAPETVENENKFDGVEPLCIWNMNGIEITVLGLEMDAFWGPTMYLEIENRSKDDILIGFNDVAVNGYMMDPFWATTVTAGNKSRETVTWLDASCVENNIKDIETVEGYFSISNDDTWDKIVDTPTIRVTFD